MRLRRRRCCLLLQAAASQPTQPTPSMRSTHRTSILFWPSAEALGGWRPDGAALESVGNDTYRGAFETQAAEVECKLTLGTWATEALDGEGYLRTNRILKIASDTLIRDTVMAWNDGTATSRVYGRKPQARESMGLGAGRWTSGDCCIAHARRAEFVRPGLGQLRGRLGRGRSGNGIARE